MKGRGKRRRTRRMRKYVIAPKSGVFIFLGTSILPGMEWVCLRDSRLSLRFLMGREVLYCVNNAMLYRTGNSALKGQTAERACETAFIVPTRLRLY